jgi:hypothetical protein
MRIEIKTNKKASEKMELEKRLRDERAGLRKRIDEIDTTLREMGKEQRRKELEKNVGKYFVERVSGTCKRYYYVIGIDRECERNAVLSIVGSGGWLEFERHDPPLRMEGLRQIPRSEWLKQMSRMKPFFERAIT